MPRQTIKKQTLNVFSAGLNTEASPLTFPENALKSGDNLDVLRSGGAKRRRSFDFETGGAYSTTTFTRAALQDFAISRHEWKSVDGQDDLNFLVIQIGGVLYFHKLGEDTISTNVIGSISLDPIKTNSDFEKVPISSAFGKGKLFIVGRFISPAYIQYNESANTFTGVKLTIKIRDFEGIPEDISDPQVFGDDITPGPTTDPFDDIDDVFAPPLDPGDFAPFVPIDIPGIGF